MSSFFAVVAVMAALVIAYQTLSRFLSFRRAVVTTFGWLVMPVAGLVRAAGAAVDFVVGARGGNVAGWHYGLWLALNLLPLTIVMAIALVPVRQALALPPYADPGILLFAAGLFQILVLVAAILSLHQTHDVMEGVAIDAARAGVGASAARGPVIAVAVVLFVVYAAAAVYWLSEVRALDLLSRRPATGLPVVDYLLVVLWSLPAEMLLRPVDWLLGADSSATFRPTLLGGVVAATLYVLGALLLAGFASAALLTAFQSRRLIAGLGRGREGERFHTLSRVKLAPSTIRRGIVEAAISTDDPDIRRRLFEAARDAEILALPEVVLRHLESFDEPTQHFALDRALELFRQRASEFERGPSETMLHTGAKLLGRAKLPTETAKRVARLMVAVLMARRGVVQLDETYRDRLGAVINREIRKASGEEGAAFRGVLQDLRAAVSRAVVAKATTPLRQAAGRGAEPGNPATTAPR